jgi:hypothetical protein
VSARRRREPELGEPRASVEADHDARWREATVREPEGAAAVVLRDVHRAQAREHVARDRRHEVGRQRPPPR